MFVAVFLMLTIAVMSVVAYVVYREDWHRGCIDRAHNRIPEWILFLLAFLLGAPGALIAMISFHYKMRYRRFKITIPILALLQGAAVCICAIAGV